LLRRNSLFDQRREFEPQAIDLFAKLLVFADCDQDTIE